MNTISDLRKNLNTWHYRQYFVYEFHCFLRFYLKKHLMQTACGSIPGIKEMSMPSTIVGVEPFPLPSSVLESLSSPLQDVRMQAEPNTITSIKMMLKNLFAFI